MTEQKKFSLKEACEFLDAEYKDMMEKQQQYHFHIGELMMQLARQIEEIKH